MNRKYSESNLSKIQKLKVDPWTLGYHYMTVILKDENYSNRDCRIGAMAYEAGYKRAKKDMKKKK